MTRTFEESQSGSRSEVSQDDRTSGTEAPDAITEIDWENVARALPGDLLEETSERREEQRQQVYKGLLGDIGGRTLEQQLLELDDVDFNSLSETGLLQFVGEGIVLANKMLWSQLQTQVDQATELVTIRESVEPYYNITVSGIEVIDNQNVPEPVVPDSDESEFAIRKLFIRSSGKNDDLIYFGGEDIRSGNGFYLRPGEYIGIDMDYRDTELYMVSESRNQEVGLLGVF